MSVENLTAMRNCGAEKVVLEVFNAHPMSTELIKKAGEALASLAQDDQMRENMISAGAVEKIVDAIDVHLEAQDVVAEMCETLCILANSQDACDRLSAKIASLENPRVVIRIIQAISSGSNAEVVADEGQDEYEKDEERLEQLIARHAP
uniref:Uncharacterized protein n=1 Tax=viral metagenome TaxID=1070528 RepID=A0A6C0F366_9ZZZZ